MREKTMIKIYCMSRARSSRRDGRVSHDPAPQDHHLYGRQGVEHRVRAEAHRRGHPQAAARGAAAVQGATSGRGGCARGGQAGHLTRGSLGRAEEPAASGPGAAAPPCQAAVLNGWGNRGLDNLNTTEGRGRVRVCFWLVTSGPPGAHWDPTVRMGWN